MTMYTNDVDVHLLAHNAAHDPEDEPHGEEEAEDKHANAKLQRTRPHRRSARRLRLNNAESEEPSEQWSDA
jgi:hypothetical protein